MEHLIGTPYLHPHPPPRRSRFGSAALGGQDNPGWPWLHQRERSDDQRSDAGRNRENDGKLSGFHGVFMGNHRKIWAKHL